MSLLHALRVLAQRSARFLAIAGVFGIAAILAGVAVVTAINLQRTSDGLDRLTQSTEVGDAYSRTTIAIALASVNANAHRLTGDPTARLQMVAAIQDAFANSEVVKAKGSPADRALLADLEARYSLELSNAVALIAGGGSFADAEAGNPLVLDKITAAFAQPAAGARENASREMAAFRSGFDRRSNAVIVAFLLALPVLASLFILIRRYERKDAIRAEELRKLGQAVLTDGLTGLRNHRAFQEDLRREASRASRSESPVSVAMIDIDDFKVINDTKGHARGDAVLSELGTLMTLLRTEDHAYRVGGDEFALILPDTELDSAHLAIERLRESVAASLAGVTISAGVSSNEDGVSATILRDHADLALYEAKHRGKNQVARFSDDLNSGNSVTAAKMTALRELLKNHSISMWFQPIFRIDTRELLAYEALMRMPSTPELSGPEEAFEIAQRMGRSHDLDLMCISGALDSVDELEPQMKLFINLDPATLMHSDFTVDELLALVEQRGIDPRKIVFEITEKTIAPMSRLARQVQALHECGFGVALDDVGSGNSGLEMMRLIKFDYVKIDRSVVLDAMNGGPGRAVILAIVAFAREAGAFMIAEGIENRAMLDTIKFDEDGLQSFWVQGVQGFLLGEPRPVSVEAFRAGPAAA